MSIPVSERATTSTELVLEIAAHPRNVALARLFVAGAARDAGIEEETIDDVKIAVSEAVTRAVRGAPEDAIVTVRVVPSDAVIAVSVERAGDATGDGAPGNLGDDADASALGFAVICALFPGASVDAATGTVRFSARSGGPPAAGS